MLRISLAPPFESSLTLYRQFEKGAPHPFQTTESERGRFELPIPCGMPVFETGAFDHSATSPWWRGVLRHKGFRFPAMAKCTALSHSHLSWLERCASPQGLPLSSDGKVHCTLP